MRLTLIVTCLFVHLFNLSGNAQNDEELRGRELILYYLFEEEGIDKSGYTPGDFFNFEKIEGISADAEAELDSLYVKAHSEFSRLLDSTETNSDQEVLEEVNAEISSITNANKTIEFYSLEHNFTAKNEYGTIAYFHIKIVYSKDFKISEVKLKQKERPEKG